MSSIAATDPTRAKLLEAAGEVFAEHGFQAATIREICARANVNVAAVNYHFRDKRGLYLEVLRTTVGAAENESIREALSQSKNAEEALRLLISALLRRMAGGDGPAWRLRIMAHEMARPSDALPQVVDEVIRPNYDKMRKILGEILGLSPNDETTRLCAHSLIGQVVHYAHARPVIALLWPNLKMTPDRFEQVANHIADFSICSLRALAKKNKQRPSKGSHVSAIHHRT